MTPLVLHALLLAAHTSDAQDAAWARFRGPDGSGVAREEAPLPAALDPAQNLAWKTPVPPGHSSPCVWRDRVFLTGEGEQGTLLTLCYSRETGAELWRRAVEPTHVERLHPINSPASPTPCCDGERVVSYFGGFGLIAYRLDGEEEWRREMPAARNTFGTGASPVFADGHLVLVRDVAQGSFLEALDPATGQPRWRVDRPGSGSGWSTPAVRRVGAVSELLVYGVWWLRAYDLSDGSERWSVPGLADEPIVTPAHGAGLVFVSSYNMNSNPEVIGLPEFEALVAELDRDADGTLDREEAKANQSVLSRHDADGEGDHPLSIFFRFLDADENGELDAEEWKKLRAWLDGFEQANALLGLRPGQGEHETEIVWSHARGVPECPSPLFYRGNVYFAKNGGLVTCLDAATGALRFEGRSGARGPCYASPVAGDGKIYLCSARGQVVVLRAGDTLEVLSSSDLGQRIMATPALQGGQVLLRTEKHLYAFE